jgi:hypothetical protein
LVGGLSVDVSAAHDDEVRGKGLLAKREVMVSGGLFTLGKPLQAKPGKKGVMALLA